MSGWRGTGAESPGHDRCLGPAPYRRPASCARALGSLGVVVDSGRRPMNPHGAKETGLRGGDLQTQVAKGWMNGHGRDTARILGTIAEQLRGVAALAGEGITREPFASVQFSAAGLALLVAAQAFRAAAEVTTAGPDGDLSEAEGHVRRDGPSRPRTR